MIGSAVLIQYTSCDGRTDHGIAVAYTPWHRPTVARKRVMVKKPSGTLGGCLRLPVYGRLILVNIHLAVLTHKIILVLVLMHGKAHHFYSRFRSHI